MSGPAEDGRHEPTTQDRDRRLRRGGVVGRHGSRAGVLHRKPPAGPIRPWLHRRARQRRPHSGALCRRCPPAGRQHLHQLGRRGSGYPCRTRRAPDPSGGRRSRRRPRCSGLGHPCRTARTTGGISLRRCAHPGCGRTAGRQAGHDALGHGRGTGRAPCGRDRGRGCRVRTVRPCMDRGRGECGNRHEPGPRGRRPRAEACAVDRQVDGDVLATAARPEPVQRAPEARALPGPTSRSFSRGSTRISPNG